MSRQVHHHGRARGFTLIELLAVIGIITILTAIVMPIVYNARRSARLVICASNLRQWGSAALLYANDNGDYLPRRGQGVGATQNITRPTDWFNALPPMMNAQPFMNLVAAGQMLRPPTESIWICPEADNFPGSYYWSYSMNMGLSVWEADNLNHGQPDQINRVGSLSVLVLFTDGPGNYCSVFPSMYAGGYNPVTRHLNNTVNICYLDGHVESVPGSYIGCGTGLIQHADTIWHSPSNTWNSAQ